MTLPNTPPKQFCIWLGFFSVQVLLRFFCRSLCVPSALLNKRSDDQVIQITTGVLPANAASSTDSIFAFIPVTIFKLEDPREAKRLAFKIISGVGLSQKVRSVRIKVRSYYLSGWPERLQNVFRLFDLCHFRVIQFASFSLVFIGEEFEPSKSKNSFSVKFLCRVLLPCPTLNPFLLRRAENLCSC